MEPGTTQYLAVSTYYGNRIHAISAYTEGSCGGAPFCGVNSERTSSAHGCTVTCPTCIKLVKKHNMVELKAPRPRCFHCHGGKQRTMGAEGPRWYEFMLFTTCWYCKGTGIDPQPGVTPPTLPVQDPNALVSKAGFAYGTCTGCENHRPLIYFGGFLVTFCTACYARWKKYDKYSYHGRTWTQANLIKMAAATGNKSGSVHLP